MRSPRLLLILASAAAWTAGAHGAWAAPLPPELTRLQHSLARIERLRATFRETRHWAALEDSLETKGSLQYERNGKLLWHTDPPSESELVMEGKTATLRYPRLGTQEVIDFASDPGMGKVFESIRAVLQADLERLEPLFKLEVERPKPLRVALAPRTAELGHILKAIRLDFDPKDHLEHVVLQEASGDTTDIVFRDVLVKTSAP